MKIKIVQDKSYKNDAHDNKGTYCYDIQFIRKEVPATLHIKYFYYCQYLSTSLKNDIKAD